MGSFEALRVGEISECASCGSNRKLATFLADVLLLQSSESTGGTTCTARFNEEAGWKAAPSLTLKDDSKLGGSV